MSCFLGQIGLPINPNELDMKIATSHGYGHGGKMGPGVPIIGLDQITSKTINKYNDIMYTCQTCTAEFTFGLRGNHLGSDEHWLKYLVCSRKLIFTNHYALYFFIYE